MFGDEDGSLTGAGLQFTRGASDGGPEEVENGWDGTDSKAARLPMLRSDIASARAFSTLKLGERGLCFERLEDEEASG